MREERRQGRLSIVLPAWNEETVIEKAAAVIGALLEKEKIPYELLFVDDGSEDRTWEQIELLSQRDARIGGLSFSRNFGKEAAILAGLAQAKGDCVAVMDCDLQHPPEKLPEMYRLWQSGAEIVEGKKKDRGQESSVYAWCAQLFYRCISRVSGFELERTSDFKLLDRSVVLCLLNMKEKNAFFRAMTSWVGFRTESIEFEVQERVAGTSKWSPASLLRYAISSITSFTTLPMQVVTLLGGAMLVATLCLGSLSLLQKLTGQALDGFTTVILLELFIGSSVMLSLGIIGYYIARIYEEVKGRPRYIVARRWETGELQERG